MSNLIWIIAALVVIALLVVLLQTKFRRQAADMLLYLVVTAENEFGAKTGDIKYSAVTSWLYEQLPTMARIFLTRKMIDTLIEDAVQYMKKYLAEVEGEKYGSTGSA